MPQPGGLGLLGTLNSPWIPWMRDIQNTQTQIQIHNYNVYMYIILDATTKRVRPTWHLELSSLDSLDARITKDTNTNTNT